jgi:broad specificity phosphatase PhoE
MTTTIHLLRHGEVHNPSGVLYGRLPGFRLSPRGHQMAQRVADWLGGRLDRPRAELTAVIASPLVRAQQTALPIAAEFGLDVETDARLIEAGNRYEGLTYGFGDGAMFHPRQWRYLGNPFQPSWGEPYVQIAQRMRAAVCAAVDDAVGETLLVTHQLPIWILRRSLEGRRLWHNPRNRQCAIASITTLYFEGDTFSHLTYAEPAADLVAG